MTTCSFSGSTKYAGMQLSAAEVLAGVPLNAGVRGTGSVWGTPVAKPAVPRAKPAALPANSSQAKLPANSSQAAPRPLDGNDLDASAASALLGLQKGQRELVSAMPHSAATALRGQTRPTRSTVRIVRVPCSSMSESAPTPGRAASLFAVLVSAAETVAGACAAA